MPAQVPSRPPDHPSVVPVAVERLRKRFGAVQALDDVSLAFRPGRLTAVLGPSGCGKTTLLRSIAGFVTVDAGRIVFGAEDVTRRPPQERATAMVFQNYALWPHMSVFDNVAYGLRRRRVPADEVRRRVRDALALVEIGDVDAVARRRPAELSGGQQQRVALARALVVEPRVLLLDEPLSNLDAKVRQRLRAEVRRVQRRVGITAIYVTHDQEEALAIADEVVVMNAGRIVQAGPPEEVYRRPADLFAADFLGVGTRLPARAEPGCLRLDGQCLPWEGPLRGPVVVVLRSADVALAPPGAPADDYPLTGRVEESLFLGAHYRHYVRLAESVILVDSAERVAAGPVRLGIPRDRLLVFPESRGSASPAPEP